jgi:hypothetical protein
VLVDSSAFRTIRLTLLVALEASRLVPLSQDEVNTEFSRWTCVSTSPKTNYSVRTDAGYWQGLLRNHGSPDNSAHG